jgi:alcohol dehydrogenase class IV
MLTEFFQFHLPTKVIAGAGLASDFGTELAELHISRPLIVCDPVVRKIGLADKVIAGLEAAGITPGGIYADVPPNSEMQHVRQVAALFQETNCDSLIALGGGSTIDTAKVANIMVSEADDIENFIGVELLTRPLKPLVVIPTTAGTGSEVTNVAVILDEAQNIKISFQDRHLLPKLAVLDPELTMTMPPQVTAATGMDALTHAMEAYMGPQASPFSDAMAYTTVQLVHQSLVTAVREPQDVEARMAMLVAACMGGIAFSHSMVGIVHAMSHTVGGLFHVAHGTANSILLPHGLRYNVPVVAAKLAQLAPALGVAPAADADATCERIIAAVDQLKAQLHALCGLPQRLREVGLTEADLPAVAAGAMMDGTSFCNPREMDEETVLAALQAAY